MPGAAQLVGEGDDAGGQSKRVVEEHDLGHLRPPLSVTSTPPCPGQAAAKPERRTGQI
jgi:hypothetical protein